MSNPINPMSSTWWYGDHDPGASEILNAGTIEQFDSYVNYVTGKIWLNSDPTVDALVWMSMSPGGESNTTRNYSSVSLNFGDSRTPNENYDTEVRVNISMTSTLLAASTANIVVGGMTIAPLSLSGVAETKTECVNFRVPAGMSYQVNQGSGTSSIVSIFELAM